MKRLTCDVLVVGSGPAGLAAAYGARRSGASRVLVLERNSELGGILPQCIHNGFGTRVFESDLTGPEYAGRWIRQAQEAGVEFMTDTMVLEIGDHLSVVATSSAMGLMRIGTEALVLAMGCRERPRGALAIPGTRPVGVFTAGTAQRMVNMEGYVPGSRFVILGSGDIGMIVARRLTIEGAEVIAMIEILPYVSGLRRNLVQCVRDYDIPLQLCTTVTEVRGRERVESVVVSRVGEGWRPIPGTEREIRCDALLLSVGLIPENELSRMAGVEIDPLTGGPFVDERLATSVPGIYAAGNVVHVYDLVDDVSETAVRSGRSAAEYARGGEKKPSPVIRVLPGENVHHVVPQRIRIAGRESDSLADDGIELQFRVRRPIEGAVRAEVRVGEEVLASRRLRYVRPSEMVVISLEPDARSRIKQGEALQVHVAE